MGFRRRGKKINTKPPARRRGGRVRSAQMGLSASSAVKLNRLKRIQPTPKPIKIVNVPVRAKVSTNTANRPITPPPIVIPPPPRVNPPRVTPPVPPAPPIFPPVISTGITINSGPRNRVVKPAPRPSFRPPTPITPIRSGFDEESYLQTMRDRGGQMALANPIIFPETKPFPNIPTRPIRIGAPGGGYGTINLGRTQAGPTLAGELGGGRFTNDDFIEPRERVDRELIVPRGDSAELIPRPPKPKGPPPIKPPVPPAKPVIVNGDFVLNVQSNPVGADIFIDNSKVLSEKS